MADRETHRIRCGEPATEAPGATKLEGEIRIANKRYLPPATLAKLLGVSTRTLARWEDARIGPPRIRIGRVVIYDLDRIPEWLERHESTPVRLGVSKPR